MALPELKQVHILPLMSTSSIGIDEPDRLGLIAPQLRNMRNEKSPVRSGLIIRTLSHRFIVLKAEPDEGIIGAETDFFTNGYPVVNFSKVQFIGIPGSDTHTSVNTTDNSALFDSYIKPFFREIVKRGAESPTILEVGKTFKIFDIMCTLEAAEPAGNFGLVDADTTIFAEWDPTPEFEKVDIRPFQDTLPRAYEYNLFEDYVKPYLKANKDKKFSVNDQFTYMGIEFKLCFADPEGPARIGNNTVIFTEGVLSAAMRNLLPPELLLQLANLPIGLQQLLLRHEANVAAQLIQAEEMLNQRTGLADEQIEQVECFKWQNRSGTFRETQCMVCLVDFEDNDEVRKLPCTHGFHKDCIDEWLTRCCECPMCRGNVIEGLNKGDSSGSGNS